MSRHVAREGAGAGRDRSRTPQGAGGPSATAAPPDVAPPGVRLAPARRHELRPLGRLAAAVTARATGGEPLGVVTTLGRHPRLFRSWLRFGATLMFRGDLPADERELVTLRVAVRTAAWYEWAQHATLAERAGLGADDVERVARGPAADGWTPRQRLLLEAVDELHDHRVVTDRTWQALTVELTDRQLIELCLLAGHYEMLAMTLNSLGVRPEASALARLSPDAAQTAHQLRHRLVDARDA